MCLMQTEGLLSSDLAVRRCDEVEVFDLRSGFRPPANKFGEFSALSPILQLTPNSAIVEDEIGTCMFALYLDLTACCLRRTITTIKPIARNSWVKSLSLTSTGIPITHEMNIQLITKQCAEVS
jgi:hypothetical protein